MWTRATLVLFAAGSTASASLSVHLPMHDSPPHAVGKECHRAYMAQLQNCLKEDMRSFTETTIDDSDLMMSSEIMCERACRALECLEDSLQNSDICELPVKAVVERMCERYRVDLDDVGDFECPSSALHQRIVEIRGSGTVHASEHSVSEGDDEERLSFDDSLRKHFSEILFGLDATLRRVPEGVVTTTTSNEKGVKVYHRATYRLLSDQPLDAALNRLALHFRSPGSSLPQSDFGRNYCPNFPDDCQLVLPDIQERTVAPSSSPSSDSSGAEQAVVSTLPRGVHSSTSGEKHLCPKEFILLAGIFTALLTVLAAPFTTF